MSIFFSPYCLAVKAEARARYQKDLFVHKNATPNSQHVPKSGEGVLGFVPLFNNCLGPLRPSL